ncbi:transglutaminase [Sorangium cellulosum]|uniref:Transglutaminase n=1 Tax=Sorangium cellulosum TaxID=56 RepID=A0A2L0F3Q5_SORCE|nr:transglutaminase family protein [Sorangium cellulosum]AUX46192.1 transglutaminase [Sorangium cellulosum]
MAQTIRKLRVTHTTKYTYDRPVERSVHKLHLCPMYDWDQRVLSHTLAITPEVTTVECEDVFGNWVTRFEITSPYTELTISADSIVELYDSDPFAFAKKKIRPAFPLVWMPWEQLMIAPYQRPVELPDTQLQELFDYAMSFVGRNDGDLMETLFEINLTLFREYQYVPGSTNLSTTPYDVFVSRRGVCQDSANLFICLARLLGIPARYVCGYIYTGNVGASRAGSDATHAWVQLYIPNIGWKGFDPTNGVLTGLDHVRVGYGRNYLDATPTAGTLFTAAAETMTVDVAVAEVE